VSRLSSQDMDLAAALKQLETGLRTPAPDWAKPKSSGRRILSLHLPRFAMDRWQIMADRRGDSPPADMPCALAVDSARGAMIHATNHAAEAAGVYIGARVVDMRAICPALHLDHADVDSDARALERLMLWSRRWAPWTARDGADGIVMDITGCAHLFGGEDAMLLQIEDRLAGLGLNSASAIAPTHGAAWGMARFGAVRAVCPPDQLETQISVLPVRALRITDDTTLLLNRLGLKTIGDLIAVPRVPLARRFARAPLVENPLMRLDQMVGKLAEPLDAPDDPPRFITHARLPEPVQDPTEWIPQLAQDLCADLEAAGFGARRITLTVYRTDGDVSSVTVATSQPSRDATHLAKLFDGKLDRIDPGYGFDLITLAAPFVEQMGKLQHRLDRRATDGSELAQTIDRLTARFGPRGVLRPAPLERHIPERSEQWRPAMAGTPDPAATHPRRPIRLLEHPEEIRVLYAVPEGPPAQFVWRRQVHRVGRFDGPERIAPEWWADKPGTRLRDYYKVEDQHGLRLWIYREGVLGDLRGAEPRWFLHGLFA
jgi:protein ImuB